MPHDRNALLRFRNPEAFGLNGHSISTICVNPSGLFAVPDRDTTATTSLSDGCVRSAGHTPLPKCHNAKWCRSQWRSRRVDGAGILAHSRLPNRGAALSNLAPVTQNRQRTLAGVQGYVGAVLQVPTVSGARKEEHAPP